MKESRLWIPLLSTPTSEFFFLADVYSSPPMPTSSLISSEHIWVLCVQMAAHELRLLRHVASRSIIHDPRTEVGESCLVPCGVDVPAWSPNHIDGIFFLLWDVACLLAANSITPEYLKSKEYEQGYVRDGVASCHPFPVHCHCLLPCG